MAVTFARIVCNSCSKCFIESFLLKLTISIVPYLNTEHLHYFQGTKYGVKIKGLLRNLLVLQCDQNKTKNKEEENKEKENKEKIKELGHKFGSL